MVGRFGEVYVMDWGLAKILGKEDEKDIRIKEEPGRTTSELRSDRRDSAAEDPESPLYTMDGDVVGTPAYMPPEQAYAEENHASDVYTIGTLMYELLALEPFRIFEPGATPLNAVAAITKNNGFVGFPGFKTRESREVPKELRSIIMKAIDPNLGERYQSVSELREDIEAYMEDGAVQAHNYFPGVGKIFFV